MAERIRVAMIASMFPPEVGGIQMHTLRLSRKLVERGAEVLVITRHHDGLPREEDVDGVRVLRVGSGDASKAVATGSYLAAALLEIGRRRRDIDVLHCHQMLSPMTIGLAARMAFGIPLLVNPHACGIIGDVWQLQHARRFTGKLRLMLARRHGDGFVAISSLIEKELASIGIESGRIHRVPNGIDTVTFRPAGAAEKADLRRSLGLPLGPLVVYAGRLAREKGPDVLLQAWPGVRAVIPDAKLVLLGDGPMREELEARAAELSGVEMRGPVPDTAPFLRAADAGVLPSRTEGMPVALLEAMACGLPVAATAAGGTPEFLEDGVTGRLVAPEDPAALAAGVALVLRQGGKYAAAARSAAERYSLDSVADRFLGLYRSLAGLRQPARSGAIAYMMSAFPTVTETFILHEILELDRRGIRVEIFPLLGSHRADAVQHPGAERLVRRAHYEPMISARLLGAQLHWLNKDPGAYLRSWWRALRGNLSSTDFLAKALVVVPRAALFARQMQQMGVQHLHCHWATHPTLAAVVIKELTGIPYSFTCHAHDIYVDRTMLGEKIAGAEFFVTISDFNRRLLTGLYGDGAAAKMSVIRCGVQMERVERRRDPAAPFTILCVASLKDYKGHSYLVDACALLRDRGLSFVALFAGEGTERPALEAQIAARGLSGMVHLLGAQSHDKVRSLIAGASVMALPSVVTGYGKMEGIPVALMEALGAELPVVATAISGIPELVEDGITGYLVSQRDAAGLADALQRVHDDPHTARRLARAGRERVEEDFSLERNTAALAELLVPATLNRPADRPVVS